SGEHARRFEARDAGEGGGVALGNAAAGFAVRVAFRKLHQSEGRLQVGQVVLVASLLDFVAPVAVAGVTIPGIAADAMEAQQADAFGKGGVRGGDHAALARCESLRSVEAESRERADGSNHLADVAGRKGGGSIFDGGAP